MARLSPFRQERPQEKDGPGKRSRGDKVVTILLYCKMDRSKTVEIEFNQSIHHPQRNVFLT